MNSTTGTAGLTAAAAATTPATHNFHISLDHLSTLRRALADLETTLGQSHAHHWPTIDPTLHTGPAAWRVDKGDSATYVYGLLNEASPLGDTHADVVRHLEDWYHRIHEMVTAMTTYAHRTHAAYSAADEAVAAAALRVADGGCAREGRLDDGGGSGGGGRSGGGLGRGLGSRLDGNGLERESGHGESGGGKLGGAELGRRLDDILGGTLGSGGNP